MPCDWEWAFKSIQPVVANMNGIQGKCQDIVNNDPAADSLQFYTSLVMKYLHHW